VYKPPAARPASPTPWLAGITVLLLALIGDAAYSRYQQYQLRRGLERMVADPRIDQETARMRAAFDRAGEPAQRLSKELGSKSK
jgi:hypothetical protein